MSQATTITVRLAVPADGAFAAQLNQAFGSVATQPDSKTGFDNASAKAFYGRLGFIADALHMSLFLPIQTERPVEKEQ